MYMPQKYKLTKPSNLPKPQKFKPSIITTHMLYIARHWFLPLIKEALNNMMCVNFKAFTHLATRPRSVMLKVNGFAVICDGT